MKLSQARRVLLYNYNEETEMIDVRHYHIGVKTTGVSKSIKKVVNTHLPDLSKFEDIADYVLKEAIVSESDVEDAQEDTTVTLAQNYHGRNNRKNEQRAVRLQEIGPRMTLQLIKVENGLCEGEVLYHRFIKLSPDEIKENERKRQKTLSEKQQRREEQQANVERKQREKEEHRKRTGAPMAVDSSDEDDNDNDDNDQDEDEDINEQIMETMDSNDEDDDNDSDDDEEEEEEKKKKLQHKHVCGYQQCQWSFKRYEHLKRHMLVHTGERPFACEHPGCTKSFGRSDNLRAHYRTHFNKKRKSRN